MSEVVFSDEIQEAVYGNRNTRPAFTQHAFKKRRLLVSLLMRAHLARNEESADEILISIIIVLFITTIIVAIPVLPRIPFLNPVSSGVIESRTPIAPSERIEYTKKRVPLTPEQEKTINAIWERSRKK